MREEELFVETNGMKSRGDFFTNLAYPSTGKVVLLSTDSYA